MSEHLISPADAASDLLSCAAFIAESIQSRDGQAQAMIAVVPQYLAKDDVDTAAELANAVEDPFVRDRLLIAVAEKCAALDDDEYALQLADAIEDLGLQSQARERIALQMAERGEIEKARETADAVGHRDTVLAGIAAKQYADGNETAAMHTVGEIELAGTSVQAMLTAAAADIDAERFEKAVGLLEKAAITADQIEHQEERIRAFIEIGNSFAAAKRNDKAIETFDHARALADVLDNVHRDSFLGSAALGFMHAGSVELADRTLDAVSDKTQIATCLLGFSRELWQRDEHADAMDALEESYAILRSQKESETRNSKAKFALFTAIAVQFAGFGKGERAIGIAHDIADENSSLSALSQIAQILTRQKEDELAHLAVNSIPDDVDRMFALIRVSDEAAAIDKERALATLEEAYASAEGVEQLASRSSAFIAFAKRFVEHGNAARAREISLENLNVIATIRDPSVQAAAIANLAEVYAESGFDLNDAEKEIVQKMVRRRSI